MENIIYHDRVAEGYNNKLGDAFGEKIRQRIHWITSKVQGGHVLDIGCSQGIVSLLLAREGKTVTGIDIDPDAIAYANEALSNENEFTQSNCNYICGDFLSMQSLKDTYDTFIITEILEHLVEPELVLEKVQSLLNGDSKVIVTVPFGINDFPDHKWFYSFKNIVDLLEQYFTIDEYSAMGKWIGFICTQKEANRSSLLSNLDYLNVIEENYLTIERALINNHKRAKENYDIVRKREKKLIDRNKALESALFGVRESVKYRLGTLIVNALKPGRDTLLFPVELCKLIIYGMKKRSKKMLRYYSEEYEGYDTSELLHKYNSTEDNDDKYGLGRELVIRLKNEGHILKLVELLSEMSKTYPEKKFLSRELSIRSDLNRMMNDPEYNRTRNDSPTKISNPQKVLNVLNVSLPYSSNGYSIRSKNVIECQKQLDIDSVVVTRPGFPSDFNHDIKKKKILKEIIDDIPYYRIEQDIFYRHTPIYKYLNIFTKKISKIIKLEKPDVVHAASNYVNGLAALRAARMANLPFIYEIRGFWELTTASKEPEFENSEEYCLVQKIETYLANQADKVVVICEGLKNELIRRGIDERKIVLAPNGVDTDKFKLVEKNKSLLRELDIAGKFVIGYIGSIVKYEGLQHVIEALSVIKKARGKLEIRYIVVGDGDYLDTLKELVHKKNLVSEVIFTGRVNHDQVIDYYSVFDLCVYSREESDVTNMVTPLKPLEAMSCNKVVIGSSTDALQELISDGINGFVYTTNEQLIALILEIKDGTLLLEDNPREWIEKNRSWDVICETYKDLYSNNNRNRG